MKKALVLLGLALISLNAAAAAQCANTTGMTEGPKFTYWIGIGTGTTLTSYQSTGTDNFLLDINIRPILEPFESEFFFKCQCGFCALPTLNDVVISNLFAAPDYVVVNNTTTINVEVTNNNPVSCTVQSLDLVIGIAHENGTTIECNPNQFSGTIPGNSSADFQCDTPALTLEGRYDVSAEISNVSFDGTSPGCTDTPLGNSKNASFVVSRRPLGVSFPVPETSDLAVAIVALAVVVLAKRRK